MLHRNDLAQGDQLNAAFLWEDDDAATILRNTDEFGVRDADGATIAEMNQKRTGGR